MSDTVSVKLKIDPPSVAGQPPPEELGPLYEYEIHAKRRQMRPIMARSSNPRTQAMIADMAVATRTLHLYRVPAAMVERGLLPKRGDRLPSRLPAPKEPLAWTLIEDVDEPQPDGRGGFWVWIRAATPLLK